MTIPPFIEILSIYLFGGITFIPVVLLVVYAVSPTANKTQDQQPFIKPSANAYSQKEKKGWIRLTKTCKPKESESNVGLLMSYVQGGSAKRQKEHVYAELRCGALFVYETNQADEDCKIIIPVHNYDITLYHPEKQQQQQHDHDMFSKSTWLKLTPKPDIVYMSGNDSQVLVPHHDDGSSYLTAHDELFITCARPVDKEDWYFGLLAATQMMAESASHVEMIDMTHFDVSAMQALIATVQQDADYREVQWLNAILGRLFLGLYKTEGMQHYLQDKISKKAKKIKRPGFLGDILVQSVDIGDSIPYVTQPKLLALTPEGDLEAEATIHYAGGLRVVIQTDFTWTYSSLMKPLKVPLVLSVTLKKLSGKFLVKVKPPPTNRCWIAFYETPDMEWEIQPIVSDKQIRLSMVTNAIQSKIREFIAENIVMPNMDDFPFCPSGGHGGIFGERVPKPSSPKPSTMPHATPINNANLGGNNIMDLDMLGNKVNKTVVPPKVVVTQQIEQDMLETTTATTTITAKTFTRRATVGNLDVSSSLKAENIHSTNRSRGYSNPNLRRTSTSSSDGNPMLDEVPTAIVSSPIITAAMTTGRRMASNIGFRKRQPAPAPVSAPAPVPVPSSTIRLPSEEEEEEEEDVSTEGDEEEQQTLGVNSIIASSKGTESIKTNSSRNSDTISSTSCSSKSSTNLLSKFNSVSKAAKLNIHTNKKLYNIAGSLFTTKKRVSKEMREERNRELLESHNRKMMSLFLNNEPEAAKEEDKATGATSPPPPLPPRNLINSKKASSPSLSSSSSEENLTITPISLDYIPKQNENAAIFLNEYQTF